MPEDRRQVHGHDEAAGEKIRLNCQGWEDARIIGEYEVLMTVAYKGRLYLSPEHKPAKFERIDTNGMVEAGHVPDKAPR